MSSFYKNCIKVTFSDAIEICYVEKCNDDRVDIWRLYDLPRVHRILNIMFEKRLLNTLQNII